MQIKLILLLLTFSTSLSLVSGQEWEVDFTTAKEVAAEKDKTIIMVFQGSDWCGPCIKLDKEIWSTEEFQSYARENYVMLQVDFPRRKKNKLSKEQSEANGILAERYNKNGIFPFVAVLDQEGNLLGETGYKKVSPITYIEELNKFIK